MEVAESGLAAKTAKVALGRVLAVVLGLSERIATEASLLAVVSLLGVAVATVAEGRGHLRIVDALLAVLAVAEGSGLVRIVDHVATNEVRLAGAHVDSVRTAVAHSSHSWLGHCSGDWCSVAHSA